MIQSEGSLNHLEFLKISFRFRNCSFQSPIYKKNNAKENKRKRWSFHGMMDLLEQTRH